LSLLIAALNYILCLIADALALFMFIFISPLIVLKYIATEKIVADQLPHTKRTRRESVGFFFML